MARIKLGMVGGGKDAFIGAVHRYAARLDDRYELVAGALSSTPEKSLESGRVLGLADDRIYPDFEAMAEAEAARTDGIEAVAIVTPNHMHAPAAKAFLSRGVHVICDKPLTATLQEAQSLVAVAEASGALFVLTHNYTGYPLMRHAKAMVAAGSLGDIRIVQVEYAQDWLTEASDAENKQAEWRTDPARSGVGGSTGDIGTHAYNLACFVSGLTLDSLAADLQSFVSGRRVDDNGHVLLRFKGGARGMLWCSQVAPGNENRLTLRIYGDKGGLSWSQENPNVMEYTLFGKPTQILTRNGASGAADGVRIPGGHPEGYLEGFANIYVAAADAIEAARTSAKSDAIYPTVQDGLAGVVFVDACVRSSAKDAAWVSV